MGQRRKAREHALQVLYQADIAGLGVEESLRTHWEREPEDEPATRAFTERLVRTVGERREAIDALLASSSRNWTLERMGVVDRNLLRLSVAELLSEPDTPPAVVIDEAVEIARDYGDRDSQSFVNGVLEAVRRRLASAGSS